jgi:hypothetical protein
MSAEQLPEEPKGEQKEEIKFNGITPVEGEEGLVNIHLEKGGEIVKVRRSTGWEPTKSTEPTEFSS